jgi:hypothetical protein
MLFSCSTHHQHQQPPYNDKGHHACDTHNPEDCDGVLSYNRVIAAAVDQKQVHRIADSLF